MNKKLSDNKIEKIFKDYYDSIEKIKGFEKMTIYYNEKKEQEEIEVTKDIEMEINQINKELNRLKFEIMKIDAFLNSIDIITDDTYILSGRYRDKKKVETICMELFITNTSYYRKKREIFDKFRKFYAALYS